MKKLLRSRKTLIVLTCVVVALVAGLKIWSGKTRRHRDEAESQFQVTRKDIVHKLNLTGKVVPLSSVQIFSSQPGRIVEVIAKETSEVKIGDPLFSLRLEPQGQQDLLQMRSEVKRLELEVAAAQQSVKEKRPVRELIGASSILKEENDLDKALVQLRSAQERLSIQEREMGLTTAKKAKQNGKSGDVIFINSPCNGIVTLINKNPGDYVLGGNTDNSASDKMVMVVADMTSLIIRTRVLEADLRFVNEGLPVQLKLDAYPDNSYQGAVVRIAGQGRYDSSGGYTYFDVDMKVDKKDGRVLPEMNAQVEIVIASKKNVLVLPIAAVAMYPERSFVFRSVDQPDEPYNKDDEVPVKVGITTEEDVEIVDGLKEGDWVRRIDFAKLITEERKRSGKKNEKR